MAKSYIGLIETYENINSSECLNDTNLSHVDNDNTKIIRKYNSLYRKKLISKIELIKNKNALIDIYKIIISDIGDDVSSNSNGMFININILSDFCISEIMHYFNSYNIKQNDNNFKQINCNLYNIEDIDSLIESKGHSFSNKEKSIIKKTSKDNTIFLK